MATRKAELTLGQDEEFEKVRAEVDATAEALDERDAEIARLKAQLEEANRRAAYTSPQDDWDRVQRLAQDAADQGLDPWQIMIAIRVPRRPPKEDPWYWININDRSVQIPADDHVQEMRLPFAETLLGMLRAENRAQDFADSIEVYDPVTNPKS